MTGKEITALAFEQQPVPRVPVGPIAGGEWYYHQAGQDFAAAREDAQAQAKVIIDAYKLLDHDQIWIGGGLLNYPAHVLGCEIEENGTSTPMLGSTALSDPAEVARLDPETALEHPIIQAIIESTHLTAEAIGQECMIMATIWGPFTTAARLMGAEQMMMATIRQPEDLEKLISFSVELNWAMLDKILDHPLMGGANLSEPVASPDMVSPVAFDKFVAPALTDLVTRIKAKNKYAMIHICGNSTGILDKIAEIDPTAFSLEAKVDLAEAKKILGGKVCVVGNVDPGGKFLSGTPDDVRAEARACLSAWGRETGFLLSTGCDFPKAVPLENIQALMEFKDNQ